MININSEIKILLGKACVEICNKNTFKLNNMKNFFRVLGISLMATIIITSCSKKDDPTDNDLFVGTYHGKVGYVTEGESKSSDDGKVTVVKVGRNYNFVFSDGIPDLKGVEFKNDGDNAVVSIDGDVAKVIRITASKLTIGYAQDGAVWTADCDR